MSHTFLSVLVYYGFVLCSFSSFCVCMYFLIILNNLWNLIPL